MEGWLCRIGAGQARGFEQLFGNFALGEVFEFENFDMDCVIDDWAFGGRVGDVEPGIPRVGCGVVAYILGSTSWTWILNRRWCLLRLSALATARTVS